MNEHYQDQIENSYSKNVPIYTQLRNVGIGRVYVLTGAMTKARPSSGDLLGRLEQLHKTPEKIMNISMVAEETPIILPVTDENDPNPQHIMLFPDGYVLLFQPKNQAVREEYLKYFSINGSNDFLFDMIIDPATGKLKHEYLKNLKYNAINYAQATYFDPKESDENKRIVLSAVDKAIENAKKIVEEQRKREKEVLEAVRNRSLDI
jgi:hypothetical protein